MIPKAAFLLALPLTQESYSNNDRIQRNRFKVQTKLRRQNFNNSSFEQRFGVFCRSYNLIKGNCLLICQKQQCSRLGLLQLGIRQNATCARCQFKLVKNIFFGYKVTW